MQFGSTLSMNDRCENVAEMRSNGVGFGRPRWAWPILPIREHHASGYYGCPRAVLQKLWGHRLAELLLGGTGLMFCGEHGWQNRNHFIAIAPAKVILVKNTAGAESRAISVPTT